MVYADGKLISGNFKNTEVENKFTHQNFKPTPAELWYQYGEAFISFNGFRLAELEYERAVKLEPNNVKYITGKGTALMSQNKIEEAMADIEKALNINPKDNQTILLKGITHFKQNEYDLVVKEFNTLIKKESKNILYLNYRAMAHYHNKEYVNAIKDFSKSLKIKNDMTNYYYRGLSFSQIDKKKEACKDLESAKKHGMKDIDKLIDFNCN
jgi:tetratricopeptide (TPR) repeat protein